MTPCKWCDELITEHCLDCEACFNGDAGHGLGCPADQDQPTDNSAQILDTWFTRLYSTTRYSGEMIQIVVNLTVPQSD